MRRRVLAALGAGVAVAVVGVAATITPTVAQVSEPTTVIMKQDTSWLVKCGTKLLWQRVTPKSGKLTCVPSTNVTTTPTTTTTVPVTTTPSPTTPTTTAPVPSPSPDGCALPAYPDASCTGVPAGTQLEVVSGDVEYFFPCALPPCVVQNKEFRGCVVVKKTPGLTIRNSRFVGNCGYQLDYYEPGELLRIEDSTFVCAGKGTAIGEERFVALRVNISGCENGFDINGHALVEDSYIHDMLQEGTAGDPHSDGGQFALGATNVTFRHNQFDMTLKATSSLTFPRNNACPTCPAVATHDVLVVDNLMMGGGYSIYCNQDGPGDNFQLVRNRFSTKYGPSGGRAAPWTDCTDEDVLIDNRWYDGAKAGQLLPGHP